MTEALPSPGKAPCGTCPYRRDVPSGVWAAEEYAKLPGYDGDTLEQLFAGATGLFFCHQQDGKLCAGWVGCHDMGEAAAVRMWRVAPETFDYRSPVPLFASGAEAAAHGMAELNKPGRKARRAIARLESKIPIAGGEVPADVKE